MTQKRVDNLTSAINRLSQSVGHPLTWNGLLTQWEKVVCAVEAGYDDTVYDYLNDLAVRTHIATILECVPEGDDDSIELIRSLDARFKNGTRPSGHSMFDSSDSRYWWNTRIPISLRGDLLDDVRSMDL